MYALHLNVYVTDICNRKCSYCYNPYNNMGNMEMSVAKDIGNWVGKATHDARVKNFRCHFLGGEPFINLNSVFTIIEIIDNNYNIPASSDGKYVIFTNVKTQGKPYFVIPAQEIEELKDLNGISASLCVPTDLFFKEKYNINGEKLGTVIIGIDKS